MFFTRGKSIYPTLKQVQYLPKINSHLCRYVPESLFAKESLLFDIFKIAEPKYETIIIISSMLT